MKEFGLGDGLTKQVITALALGPWMASGLTSGSVTVTSKPAPMASPSHREAGRCRRRKPEVIIGDLDQYRVIQHATIRVDDRNVIALQ